MWRFVGLEINEDERYVCTVQPFGLSLACAAITDLVGAVWIGGR